MSRDDRFPRQSDRASSGAHARPARGGSTAVLSIDVSSLDLPRLFTPLQAAEILRGLGLTDITECALRTRAYRRQVPFHLNGRRIAFTAGDLRDIIEGQPHRPRPPADPPPSRHGRPTARTVARRAPPCAAPAANTWRARGQPGNEAPAART